MSAAVAATMRASQYLRYGPPEVLHEASVDVPHPGHGEVLVSVHGSGVNPLDARIRRGGLRVASGFTFPKGIGLDYAGEIASLGEGVEGHAVGDAIWGFLPGIPGRSTLAVAEYVVVRVGTFSAAPTSIDLTDAAALPLAASTALLALRDHAHLKAGEKLLVRGGSGGVGTAAIQLAVALGAEVTALTGPSTLNFVRELGAHAALDYHTHGPSQLGKYDVILDLNGHHLASYRRQLGHHGRMVTTSFAGAGYIVAAAIFGPKRIRTLAATPQPDVLSAVAEFVERGQLAPIIDGVYPLADTALAHAALERGAGRGKQLIDVRA